MINNGYLIAKNKKRLFINTSIGCKSNCSYCYLPSIFELGKHADVSTRSTEVMCKYNRRNYK